MRAQTPMLQQYFQAKEAHPGVLLAMRVGDFYEFYGEDAETAASALEITLTGREDGSNGRVSMAGVPYHSVEKYIARLLSKGLKVALCDQIEDPKAAKGLVRRAVTRVLTPGTVIEDSMLSSSQNNFLAAICVLDGRAGLATLDPSTGEFLVTELDGESLEERLLQELARVRPSELLVPSAVQALGELAKSGLGVSVTESEAPSADRAERALRQQFGVKNLQGFGCDAMPGAIAAASMILGYAARNGLNLQHVDSIATYSVDEFMVLDSATRRSLELTSNLVDGGRLYTLLEVLDQTVTAMGQRLIRRWIDQPLLDLKAIQKRQDAIERLIENGIARGDLRDSLKKLKDIERLVSRCSAGLAGPRDLASLKFSLENLPELFRPLHRVAYGRLQEICSGIDEHADLTSTLRKSIVDDPPHALRDGGVLKDGFDIELDKLRSLSRDGKNYIAALEQSERQRTGINTLKVGYNSVFGYYLEVNKTLSDRVPAEYVRKQTTANAERYITAELKDHESAVLGAQQKATNLESDIFHKLRGKVADQSKALLQTARALAELDALCSLAEVAARNGYVKPVITEGGDLEIVAGRHPVVEANRTGFVPNDTSIGGHEEPKLIILTGPNMSGKSTYLRQNALIVLMAQIGSYVPATQCTAGLCDRIFARIGAKDELALGQSTFMVEMVESANILNHASPRSLVILDEIGRGTSTYDGLAIAWAMVEYLHGVGCKTMFATHYHQLNELAHQLVGVANFRVSVEEIGDDVIWTHKVLQGGTDRSYGIHVARMAGVPMSVLTRAASILGELEGRQSSAIAPAPEVQRLQMKLFESDDPVGRELSQVDVNALTPLEALQLLDDWKRRFSST